MDMREFKVNEFIKLPKELKDSAKTLYDYVKIVKVTDNGNTLDVYFVDESSVDKKRLHLGLQRQGLTFLFFHYDIHF